MVAWKHSHSRTVLLYKSLKISKRVSGRIFCIMHSSSNLGQPKFPLYLHASVFLYDIDFVFTFWVHNPSPSPLPFTPTPKKHRKLKALLANVLVLTLISAWWFAFRFIVSLIFKKLYRSLNITSTFLICIRILALISIKITFLDIGDWNYWKMLLQIYTLDLGMIRNGEQRDELIKTAYQISSDSLW